MIANSELTLQATPAAVYGKGFEAFMAGVHNQMGGDVRPDLGVSIDVFHHILGLLDLEFGIGEMFRQDKTNNRFRFYVRHWVFSFSKI